MANLFDTLREVFTFSAGERRGIIVLILILIIISSINVVILTIHPNKTQDAIPGWMNDSGVVFIPGNPVDGSDSSREELPIHTVVARPFLFDPNDASFEELLQIGFSRRVSHTILNYRNKGGRFHTPEDMKKIYGLSPAQYARIAGFIRILPPVTSPVAPSHLSDAGPAVVDINLADSSAFEKLPGIGPVLAKRIIKYRTLLGGYCNPAQLREVYGISDSLYREIGTRLAADTIHVKKINLNTVSEKELAHHPYVGRYIASAIIRYRTRVTIISNVNELKINGLVPKEIFDKIRVYLSV